MGRINETSKKETTASKISYEVITTDSKPAFTGGKSWTNGLRLNHTSLDSPNYFCRQRGGLMPNGYYYADGSSIYYDGTTDKEKSNYDGYYYSWIFTTETTSSCHSYDDVQYAIWSTGLANNYYSGNYINTKAKYYAWYKQNYKEPTVNETTVEYLKNDIIGPFQINYYQNDYFGGIKSVKLYAENGNEITSGWNITDKNGKNIDISPKTDFYIKFDNINSIIEQKIVIPKLKITFNKHYSTKAIIQKLKGTRTVSGTLLCEGCRENNGYWKKGTPTLDRSYSGTFSTSGSYRSSITSIYRNGSLYTIENEYSSVSNGVTIKYCSTCGYSTTNISGALHEHRDGLGCSATLKTGKRCTTYVYSRTDTWVTGCGCSIYSGDGYYLGRCGSTYSGTVSSQRLIALTYALRTWTQTTLSIDVPLKIDICGNVWEDGQTGLKSTNSPNGMMDDNEAKVKEVRVSLWRVYDDSLVTTDIYNETIGNARTEGGSITPGYFWTNENGDYKIENIPVDKYGYGYYVKFEYDGVNYKATTAANEPGEKVSVGIENAYNKRNTYRGKKNSI